MSEGRKNKGRKQKSTQATLRKQAGMKEAIDESERRAEGARRINQASKQASKQAFR